MSNTLKTICRWPVDQHVVVKTGEEYPSTINDTRAIGEEINMIYTVASAELT